MEGVEGAKGGREVDSACGVCPNRNQPVGMARMRINRGIRTNFFLLAIS